jgi:hypothetical protein
LRRLAVGWRLAPGGEHGDHQRRRGICPRKAPGVEADRYLRGLCHLPSGGGGSSRENVESVDPAHLWTLTGPVWEIHGKVINVESGDVLAIVNLWQSTVWALKTQVFRVPYEFDSLVPTPTGQRGWVINKFEDTDLLKTNMMSLLAAVIAGPPEAPAVEKDLNSPR